MKTIILTLLTLLLTTNLSANKKLDSQMRSVLHSIVEIRKSGLYDDKKAINNYSNRLITSADEIIALIEKPCLEKTCSNPKHDHTHSFTKKSAQMIKMYAKDLILSVNNNNMKDAMNNYAQIQTQFYMMSRVNQGDSL